MQSLQRLSTSPEASWYEIEGDFQGPVRRYVLSTPWTRDICNKPELLGVEFNLALQEAMAAALRTAPFREVLTQAPQDRVCVVNFLRGGLNFELRRALHTAFGYNRHSSAFMSSQRYREEGRWHVKEDMYRKLEIPRDAVLIMGDVVATGVTMENGLDVILDHMAGQDSSLASLVFFTIGCHKAEKVLERIDARARKLFPSYDRTVLVYIEGKFRLVDSKSELRIGIPGTDLVRNEALLPPELVASQWQSKGHVLERCAIYDAGSRAFDVATYADDVLEYWDQVARFAAEGWTLLQAVDERWPDPTPDRDAWVSLRRQHWKGLPEDELFELHRTWCAFRDSLGGADALAALCDERCAAIRAAAGVETNR